jgi:hypothetical protein
MAGATGTVPGMVEAGRANAMKQMTSLFLCVRAMAVVLVAVALMSCVSGPTIQPAPATSTESGMVAVVFIEVQPSLREAVRKASSEYPSLIGAAIGTRPATPVEYTILLSFFSRVDGSRQLSNQGGAVAGGLLTMITGAVVPWPCPTTHELSASVLRSDGTQLAHEFMREQENRVGTMVWCPDVTEPSEALAAKMASALFRKLENDGVLGAPRRR